MNFKLQLTGIVLLAALTARGAFSQVRTNVVSPKQIGRNIGGQIYDIGSLPYVRVPPTLSYRTIGYNGVPNQPIRLQGFLQAYPLESVTFENFPFDPRDFSAIHGINGLQPNRALYCRALMTSAVTNWNVLNQPVSIDIVYDCGVPVTNVIPANPSPQ